MDLKKSQMFYIHNNKLCVLRGFPFMYTSNNCKNIKESKQLMRIWFSMASSTTRTNLRSQQCKIYLIGNVIPQLLGSKLPSNKEVLGVLFFHTRTLKLEVRKSEIMVVNEVLVFWDKARIPTRDKSAIVLQVEKLYQEWRNLSKGAPRGGPTHKAKEEKFVQELDDLFDIAHVNALIRMPIQKDRDFLLTQRKKGRPGSMTGIEKRKLERAEAEEQRRKRAATEINSSAIGKYIYVEYDPQF